MGGWVGGGGQGGGSGGLFVCVYSVACLCLKPPALAPSVDPSCHLKSPPRLLLPAAWPTPPLQVNECTAELKANLQEEHLAGMEFIGTVFKTILSPLQKARAIVQSYPFYPDVYQVGAAGCCWAGGAGLAVGWGGV